MDAIKTPDTSPAQLLAQKSGLVRKRFSKSDDSLGEIIVRKFTSRLEPDTFYREGKNNPFDKARFRLVMSNEREEWYIHIDLIFHSRKRLLSDGSMIAPGIQFNVITEENRGLLIDYFSIEAIDELQDMDAEQWCAHWFRKLIKSPNLSSIFAHKEFERELEI